MDSHPYHGTTAFTAVQNSIAANLAHLSKNIASLKVPSASTSEGSKSFNIRR